jgi:hypothetical protein
LKDVLLAQDARARVIDDAVELLEDEVRSKTGVSGMAVKAGYKVFKKVKPGVTRVAVDNLLDDFAEALDPYYQEHLESGRGGSIAQTLLPKRREVAESLLSITDARAEKHEGGVLKKTYYKLRPTAVKHTEAAVPGVARLVDKHTAGID